MNDKLITFVIGFGIFSVGIWNLALLLKGYGGTLYPLGIIIKNNPTNSQKIELTLRAILLLAIGVVMIISVLNIGGQNG